MKRARVRLRNQEKREFGSGARAQGSSSRARDCEMRSAKCDVRSARARRHDTELALKLVGCSECRAVRAWRASQEARQERHAACYSQH